MHKKIPIPGEKHCLLLCASNNIHHSTDKCQYFTQDETIEVNISNKNSTDIVQFVFAT